MAGLTSTGTAAIAGLTPTAPAPTTATALMPTGVQPKLQLIKSDRSAHLFSSSDDKAVVKQIISTHSPDGREIDTRSLLRLVEDILQRATPTVIVTPQTHQELVDDKVHHIDVVGMLEALAYTIHRISCEITCKCSGGGDAHSTTMVLFNSLTSYTWDAKVVIAMAAFAVSYGEFWLTAQLHTVNPLAKSVALLKQLPDILEHTDALKPRFDALNNLIKAMLDVTKCIIQFKDLPSDYISLENPDMAMALTHIPTAVYWTIRSVVACSSQIISLIGLGHEYITATTEAWELSSLAHKLSNIHGHLMKQLELLYRYIGEKKHVEAFQTLLRLFEAVHIDNMKILKAMISSKDDLPLVDGATKKRVSVDVLRRKIVMLFISDLDISHEELFVLIQIYNDTHQQRTDRNYEVVWLPVTDRHFPWDNSKEETFNRLASNMPWYSLYHPSLLEPAVVRYIREIWHFDKRPQLVVLDPQGKVVCPNALHMMWIWGSLAFPFTSNREEALWKDETWRLEFLVDEIDPVLLGWIREGRHVCLYGGEDIAWIRQFTTAMRRVSREAWVWLGMVYVGKSRQRDRVREAITTVIADEKLSGYWQDPVMAWFFWVRLESMWHSKMQHGRTIENDPIMKEVTTMLTFDGGDEGWAIVSRGSLEMVKSNGRKMVECLGQFDKWKANVETEGFVPALANALVTFQAMSQYCSSLILRDDIDRINEPLVCNVCKRPIDPLVCNVCNRPIDRPINPLVCNVCNRPIDRPINPLVCNVCNRPIDPFVLYAALDERAEKKHGEAFQTLLQLFKALHLDNTKILKAMISSKDELPLVDGVTKKRMSVDVLRWKIVMLFISDLDISHEEFFVLIQIYSDTYQQRTDRNYEVVWLPVTDRHFPWGDSKEETFNWLASTMPWYSLYHPSLLEPAAVMYIRKIWHFDKRPQLVVLDPQGKVVCPNALHMMWIWGSLAFPFTSSREEVLWKDETWRLEFLVDKIDPVLLGWIREGRHVCLYGGEDIAWIRLFTTAMRRVSQEAWVPLEMVYVGRSRQRDRVREAITVIADEKLSGYWQDPMMVRFFWLRLESMWHSKMQHGRTIENDPIMKEVTTMLRFDRGDAGWAIVSRGSLDIAKANGRKMVECLSQFDEWKPDMERKGLVPALANALQKNSHNDPLLILRSL